MNKTRRYGTLKAAVADLVERCGGLRAAAEIARVGRSQLHRYTDNSDQHAEINIPCDVARSLERSCGTTPVTEWMAHDAGAVLMHFHPDGQEPLDVDVAKLAAEAAEFFQRYAQAKADGRLDLPEKEQMLREAHDIVRVVMCGIVPDLMITPTEAGKPSLRPVA